MSDAQLKKIEQDIAKLEDEADMLKKAQPVAAACDQIVSQILKTPDSFCSHGKGGPPNPWLTNSSSEGGCCVVS